MSENVEEKQKELPKQEEEDSGEDEDLGKYMIDDDDDLPVPPVSKNSEEKKIDIEDQKKELFSAKELRDVS